MPMATTQKLQEWMYFIKENFLKSLIIFVSANFIFAVIVMIANYDFPDFFDLEVEKQDKTGVVFTKTLIKVSDEMASNWLPNDLIWPTILLDNPQSFQLGELEVVRYSIRVLRDNLSRMRTTDSIDKNADMAYVNFSNDQFKWIFPSAESKWNEGIEALGKYSDRLNKDESHFYPRADNLIELLSQYNSLLGGVATRLSNIPSDINYKLTEETAGDQYSEGEQMKKITTSWWQTDNEFYYAQGVAYSLRQMLLAIRHEFQEILRLKKATELLDNIIAILKHTQWEPKYMVMNCSPGSWFPCQNDPMMLGSRLQDSRQKIHSIVSMLRD